MHNGFISNFATIKRTSCSCACGRRIAVSRDQGPDARLVVSEPIGDLPGVWTEVPEASYGWSVRGTTKFLPITPRPLARPGANGQDPNPGPDVPAERGSGPVQSRTSPSCQHRGAPRRAPDGLAAPGVRPPAGGPSALAGWEMSLAVMRRYGSLPAGEAAHMRAAQDGTARRRAPAGPSVHRADLCRPMKGCRLHEHRP